MLKVVLLLLSLMNDCCQCHFFAPKVIHVTHRRKTPPPSTTSWSILGRRRLGADNLWLASTQSLQDEQQMEEEEEEQSPSSTSSNKKKTSFTNSWKRNLYQELSPEEARHLPFFQKFQYAVQMTTTYTVMTFALGVGGGTIAPVLRGLPHMLSRNEGMLGTPLLKEWGMRWVRYSAKIRRWQGYWIPYCTLAGLVYGTMSTLVQFDPKSSIPYYTSICVCNGLFNRKKGPKRIILGMIGYSFLGWFISDNLELNKDRSANVRYRDPEEFDVDPFAQQEQERMKEPTRGERTFDDSMFERRPKTYNNNINDNDQDDDEDEDDDDDDDFF